MEIWRCSQLCFALVIGHYERGVLVRSVEVGESVQERTESTKVSFGEIVSVWPMSLCPDSRDKNNEFCISGITADVNNGLALVTKSLPRTLSLIKAYDEMRQIPKTQPLSRRTSVQIASMMYPQFMKCSRGQQAAYTVATALLVATDSIRFKRGEEGRGWRALTQSVTVARGRCSFLDACKKMLDETTPARDRVSPWTRDHLEILRDIEICAASGSIAKGTAGTALQALGYDATDDGASSLLLDIGYWGIGSVEMDGGGSVQQLDTRPPVKREACFLSDRINSKGVRIQEPDANELETSTTRAQSHMASSAAAQREDKSEVEEHAGALGTDIFASSELEDSNRGVRDWTFSPPILAEARELRSNTHERRAHYMNGAISPQGPRRLISRGSRQTTPRIYCVDDKSARFLDDALSIEHLKPGRLVRISVHVADVDEVVRSGSAMDRLAKERGESLYLPLKPLHMLPAAAMDAASFSTVVPTEAITASMEVDMVTGEFKAWEVFASLVPPVTRINYDQYDAALSRKNQALISEEIQRDLQAIAKVVPLLVNKLDTRRTARKNRESNLRTSDSAGNRQSTESPSALERDIYSREFLEKSNASDGNGLIAGVRLVKKRDNKQASTTRVAQVVDYRSTGSFAIISDLLVCTGTLFRQFAHRHGAFLPEERGAWLWVSRCGTAPLRRYADLAIQRQIKCILFGRQPAGRRRMEELRAWLAKRHAAGEKTVALSRKMVLFDSLADHCAQQRLVTKCGFATMTARVYSVSINHRNILRAEVGIDGTGISTVADVDPLILGNASSRTNKDASFGTEIFRDPGASNNTSRLSKRRASIADLDDRLKKGDRVKIHVFDVNTAAQLVNAQVVAKL